MIKISKLLCFTLLFTTVSVLAVAQNPEGWDDNDSQDTPIDGGLSLLIAAGAGYGIKKMRDKQKKGS